MIVLVDERELVTDGFRSLFGREGIPSASFVPEDFRDWMATAADTDIGSIRVSADGRDPEIEGEAYALPRRERRILEYLIANRGKRVTKAQIFNAIYGVFDEDVEENVVESHISKLRKKLRKRLGVDPIDSKRFLGYCIDWS